MSCCSASDVQVYETADTIPQSNKNVQVSEKTVLLQASNKYAEAAEERAWEMFCKWQHLADKKQNTMFSVRVVVLSFTVIGAGFQALGTLFANPEGIEKILAMVGGILIGVAPFLSRTFLTKANVERKVNSRLMAELVKAEVYKSIARVNQYENMDRYGRDEVFDTEYQNIIHKVQPSKEIRDEHAFSKYDTSEESMSFTQEMQKYLSNREFYIKTRIDIEIDDLQRRSSSLYRNAKFFDGIQNILSLISGAIGVGGGSLGIENKSGIWVSFFATAATALTAHIQSMQYEAKASKVSKCRQRVYSHFSYFLQFNIFSLFLLTTVAKCKART